MSDGSRTLAPLVASLVIAMTPNTLRAQSADEAATRFIAAYEQQGWGATNTAQQGRIARIRQGDQLGAAADQPLTVQIGFDAGAFQRCRAYARTDNPRRGQCHIAAGGLNRPQAADTAGSAGAV